MNDGSDIWRDWLLQIRHAGDPETERRLLRELGPHVRRVLDGARLGSGMTLADVGSGDGLIGLSAIDRIGASLRVILADISRPLLRHVEALSIERGVRDQCRFVECSATQLEGIETHSVDAVTTRAVLAYVDDKPAAMREFKRVLKPGGRLSISEPILRDDAFEAASLRKLIEALPKEDNDNFFRLLHRWKSAMFPDTEQAIAAHPLTNFGERDLVRFALDAGFEAVHMEFHIDVQPATITSWQVLLNTSPHPWAPRLGDVLAERFSAEERMLFESVLRPQVDGKTMVNAERTAYLTARKPDASAS
jgi:arsenite methyltransferase